MTDEAERAETHLRLLAEEELRRAAPRPADRSLAVSPAPGWLVVHAVR
jgi:hypothetical protein